MHQTRAETSRKIPVKRKGTKYLARALGYQKDSVPVIIAVRDMLALAKNKREVKSLVKSNLIKINGKLVRDIREPILLLGVLDAGKKYRLELTESGKYKFEETKESGRICKIIGKKINSNGKVQLNLHDGTNLISKEKIDIGNSVELDDSNKIKKVIPLEKGNEVLVMSGKSIGHKGKIIVSQDKKVKIKLNKGKEVMLEKEHIIAI